MSLRILDEKNGDTLYTVIPRSFIGGFIRFLLTECRNDGAVWLHFSKWRKLMGIQVDLCNFLISCNIKIVVALLLILIYDYPYIYDWLNK